MNSPDPDVRFRRRYRIETARLAGYDYGASGLYFVTICTRDRYPFFGTIADGANNIEPSVVGSSVLDCWQAIPDHFPFVVLDAFQLMPNHLHGIIWIDKPDHTDWQPNQFGPQSQNLASVIRGFKVGVTKQARIYRADFGWQPRYHDRIIRDDAELQRVRDYIDANPANWPADQNNPAGLTM
jgi:putative transposase